MDVSFVEWVKARVKAYNHRDTIESINEPDYFDYRGLQVQVQYWCCTNKSSNFSIFFCLP